jgi:hemerythrin-like metal-binding protein
VDNEPQDRRWREEFALHTEDVRIQHRRLTGLIRDLASAINTSGSEKAVASRFADLVGYLEIHFSDEEEFMKRGRYPLGRLQAHARAHQAVLVRLRSLSEQQSNGEVHCGSDVAVWLKQWLRDEETPEDERYLDYFRENIRSEMLERNGSAENASAGDQRRCSDPNLR